MSQWEKGVATESVSDGGESEPVGEGGCDGERVSDGGESEPVGEGGCDGECRMAERVSQWEKGVTMERVVEELRKEGVSHMRVNTRSSLNECDCGGP